MSETNIEWADRVWNPVTGCTKVSQGCKNCYAEGVANRFWEKQYPPVPVSTRADLDATNTFHRPRRFTDVQTHSDRLLEPLRWRKPARIFVNSMSDLFHEDVPAAFIRRVFDVMAQARRHTFLVLTKRPQRMRELVSSFAGPHTALDGTGWPLPNVHLGVSVENQPTADERIPQLLQTPAAIRWVSYEPALGPVDFDPFLWRPMSLEEMPGHALNDGCTDGVTRRRPGLDWIVVGGESGSGARPFDVAWARETVQQCKAAGVPVFVKQLGAHPFDLTGTTTCASPASDPLYCVRCRVRVKSWPLHVGRVETVNRKGGDPAEWPEALRVRELPEVRA